MITTYADTDSLIIFRPHSSTSNPDFSTSRMIPRINDVSISFFQSFFHTVIHFFRIFRWNIVSPYTVTFFTCGTFRQPQKLTHICIGLHHRFFSLLLDNRPDTNLCSAKDFFYIPAVFLPGLDRCHLKLCTFFLVINNCHSDIIAQQRKQPSNQSGFLHIRIIYAHKTH